MSFLGRASGVLTKLDGALASLDATTDPGAVFVDADGDELDAATPPPPAAASNAAAEAAGLRAELAALRNQEVTVQRLQRELAAAEERAALFEAAGADAPRLGAELAAAQNSAARADERMKRAEALEVELRGEIARLERDVRRGGGVARTRGG